MKLGNIGNILIVCMLIFLYTSMGGGILASSAPQVTTQVWRERWYNDTSRDYREAGFHNVSVTNQDSLQYKLGDFLMYPGSVILPFSAVFVNVLNEKLNEWWKKR